MNLSKSGYTEQVSHGLFTTIWMKQVGPLLLLWHEGPDVKIDVLEITNEGNNPIFTVNFVTKPIPIKPEIAEAGILEMYKSMRNLSQEAK